MGLIMSNLPLFQEIDNAFDFIIKPHIPKVITDNIKQPLRSYQTKVLQNFIFYNISKKYKDISHKHLLFHMATGSGKTNIIASSMLYLYEQGYRYFIFFVNTQNIITKTKANLIDKYSSKYLFKDTMKININEINDNFNSSKKDNINIMFTTIHKLHADLGLVKENNISYADFENRKIVLIADEAHHLNSEFKIGKKNKSDQQNINSWSMTKNKILQSNKDNILLEFTATAEIGNNLLIKQHYQDKIIAEYPLIKFREDQYSKDIRLISDSLNQEQRILQSLMISEYRQIIAEKELNLNIKPIIMFKNPKGIKNVDQNFKDFVKQINKLDVENLEKIFNLSNNKQVKALFFLVKNDLKNFARRLKLSFGQDRCLVIYSTSADKQEKLGLLNSLENIKNPIRVVFAVNVLNEGWDVLNLYDIVKLDEANKTHNATTSEAQLIGRGARYYPFQYQDTDKYKRKFDNDLSHPLRLLEEMFFYSVNDNEYIKSLKESLIKEGLQDKNQEKNTIDFKIKESFLKDEVYQNGYIYLNEQEQIDKYQDIKGLNFYSNSYQRYVTTIDNSDNQILILDDNNIKDVSYKNNSSFYIKDNLDIFRLAINKNPFFYFSNIKKFLPNLKSISMFCNDYNYLGNVEFVISSTSKISIDNKLKLKIFASYLTELQNTIENNFKKYKGSKEFKPVKISDRLKNKLIKAKYSDKTITQDSSWYVFESHKGTLEEYSFVNFIAENISKLRDFYSDIKLIRNEKAFEIYSFKYGSKFELDFILLAKHKENDFYYQIFCEPKGEYLIENDKWKEELLNEITKLTNSNNLKLDSNIQLDLQISETKHHKIYGLPFYTKSNQDVFKESFEEIVLN